MELTIKDIAGVVQLIDVVTTRGAFRGEELSGVGVLRDKFAAFVKAAEEQATEAQPGNVDLDPEAEFEDAEFEEVVAPKPKTKK